MNPSPTADLFESLPQDAPRRVTRNARAIDAAAEEDAVDTAVIGQGQPWTAGLRPIGAKIRDSRGVCDVIQALDGN